MKLCISDKLTIFFCFITSENQRSCNNSYCVMTSMRTNLVRVAVTARSPVLQVAVSLLRHVPGDPDAAAPVGHPGTEVVDAGGLVLTSQPPLIVL